MHYVFQYFAAMENKLYILQYKSELNCMELKRDWSGTVT